MEDLLRLHRGDTPSHRNGRWRAALETTDRFEPDGRRRIPSVQTLDADGLVHRVASSSFIARLIPERRAAVLAEARRIAADLPDRFPFPYTTEIEILLRR